MIRPIKALADTNVFIRLFVQDDPAQAAAAVSLIERVRSGALTLVVTPIVMVEVAWVLASAYRLTNAQIRDYLFAILNTDGIEVAQADLISAAADLFVVHNIDFADAFNAVWSKANAVETVYTFDQRHFGRIPFITARLPD